MQLNISCRAGSLPDFNIIDTHFSKFFSDFQTSTSHLNKHEKLQMISQNLSWLMGNL